MFYLIETIGTPMEEHVTFCSTWEGVVVAANVAALDEDDTRDNSTFTVATPKSEVFSFMEKMGFRIHTAVMGVD